MQPFLNCYNLINVNGKPEYKLIDSFPCSSVECAAQKAEKYVYDMNYYNMIQLVLPNGTVYAEYEY